MKGYFACFGLSLALIFLCQLRPVQGADTLPPPDQSKIRATETSGGKTTVTGLAGAVPPGSTVLATNLGPIAMATAKGNINGGFSLSIEAKTCDELEIVYFVDGKISDPIKIKVPGTSIWDILKGIANVIIEVGEALIPIKKAIKLIKPLFIGQNNQRSDVKMSIAEKQDGAFGLAFGNTLIVDLPPGVTLAGMCSIEATGDLELGPIAGNEAGSSQFVVPVVASGGDGIPDSITIDLLPAGVNVMTTATEGTAYMTLRDSNGPVTTFPIGFISGDPPNLSLLHNNLSGRIGTDGGSLTNDMGDGIIVPEDALGATAYIAFESLVPVPNSTFVPWGVSTVVAARDFYPKSLPVFATPATISISYTDEEIAMLDESHLQLAEWNMLDQRWDLMPGVVFNHAANTVTWQTNHLGTFGIAGTASCPLGMLRHWPVGTSVNFFSEVTDSSPMEFFCEDADRSSGVRVVSAIQPSAGSRAIISGTIAATSPEMVIHAEGVAYSSTSLPTIKPLGMANVHWPDIANCLLSRVCGRVITHDGTTAVLDNGSGQMTLTDIDVTFLDNDFLMADTVLRDNRQMRAIHNTCHVLTP